MHLALQATESGLRYWASSVIYFTPKPDFVVTHFLQQGHTYSNKITPPKSVTPYEVMEANNIQRSRSIFIYTEMISG